jgi:hypothetical protein
LWFNLSINPAGERERLPAGKQTQIAGLFGVLYDHPQDPEIGGISKCISEWK